MKDHNPMHPCTLTTALPYLRIPKRRILTKRKDSRTSPGLFRSQGCRYGRIRTRFAPARRAALLYAACTVKPRSETLLVGHGPTAPPRVSRFRVFVSAAARNQLAGMKRLSTRLEPYSLWLTSCQRTLLFVCQRTLLFVCLQAGFFLFVCWRTVCSK